MNHKKILAIETSGELCSVALSFEYDKYDERNILMKHIHSEKLVPMIKDILSSNKIEAGDLDCIAVSNGPGSFTGLRIGMTSAKAIAFAAGLPIVPVPTFGALSLEINEFLTKDTEYCIINNANLEECYFGRYRNSADYSEAVGDVKLLEKSKLDEQTNGVDLVFGNLKAMPGIKSISSPRASSVAKWTYLFGEDLLTFEYDYLEPNYLKKFKVKQKK